MAYGDGRHAAPFQVLLTLEKLALLKLRESERSNDAPTVAQDTCALRDFQTACLMMQPKGAMQHGYLRPTDFQTWIDLCTLRKASDSRDLVFGFWSFLPASVQHVPVDYCRPASIVIGACRTAFVKLTNNLEYLQHANYAVENAEAGFRLGSPPRSLIGAERKLIWGFPGPETLPGYHHHVKKLSVKSRMITRSCMSVDTG